MRVSASLAVQNQAPAEARRAVGRDYGLGYKAKALVIAPLKTTDGS